jgi:chromosome segregation ATPase
MSEPMSEPMSATLKLIAELKSKVQATEEDLRAMQAQDAMIAALKEQVEELKASVQELKGAKRLAEIHEVEQAKALEDAKGRLCPIVQDMQEKLDKLKEENRGLEGARDEAEGNCNTAERERDEAQERLANAIEDPRALVAVAKEAMVASPACGGCGDIVHCFRCRVENALVYAGQYQ